VRIRFDDSFPPSAGGVKVSFDTTKRWLLERGHQEWNFGDGRVDVGLHTWYGAGNVKDWTVGYPTVYFVDSWWHNVVVGRLPRLTVFNTDYLRDNAPWRKDWADMRDLPGPYKGDAFTLHPPVLEKDWAAGRLSLEDRYFITLVNLSARKGGELFFKLARDLPHRRFLGVIGSYGKQILPDDMPPNVEIRSFSPGISDMQRVYEVTDTLIVPSQETFGRVLVEAAYAGVPNRLALAGPGVDETGCASQLPDLDPGKWRIAIEHPPKPPLAPPVSEEELEVFEAKLLAIASEKLR
jgi:glycosyltransferase involved in cell wall biosynthesis